ncbi:hypothetical protein NITGR_110002 [Nitrospina gracilis 3/211]|uniref:Uncharacterized protein n=1 Tax=Nitrospina gracilis (strain 3/211) TaxID=1266370 RepID=M1YV89_NITG3|nr:hypothetical protein NITGR_110002 [Nitrospina gracilis 3/211]
MRILYEGETLKVPVNREIFKYIGFSKKGQRLRTGKYSGFAFGARGSIIPVFGLPRGRG